MVSVMGNISTGQWHNDPTGRHQYRYFDGVQWTDHVSDNGVSSVDPLNGTPQPVTQPVTQPVASPYTPVAAQPYQQQQTPQYVPIAPQQSNSNTTKIVLGVLAGLAVLTVLFIGGCALFIGGAVTEINKEYKKHAISAQTFNSFEIGEDQSDVVATAGKQPLRQPFFNGKDTQQTTPPGSACVYYNRSGGSLGDIYQLCFIDNKLVSKNAY